MLNYAQFSLTQMLSHFGVDISLLNEQDYALLEQSNAMVNDTRKLSKNDIFCAIVGEQQDGREYIDQAIKLGAAIVLIECDTATQHGEITRARVGSDIALAIKFYQLNYHLFALCQHYYQVPQKQITMIGVTGTNGKTSTCQIIAKLLEANHQSCAVIGTLGVGKVDDLTPIANTTPGATELHQYLNTFKEMSIENVAMEVSSHALSQRRITNNIIDIAVFTNLTRDHLDYHHTMAAYSDAKKEIFNENSDQIAILNGDDQQAQQWLTHWNNQHTCIVYGKKINVSQYPCFVMANNIHHTNQGTCFDLITHLGELKIQSPLLGDFNVDNLLAAISVLLAKKQPLNSIIQAVLKLTPVIGRMESYSYSHKAMAVVDYAHTPDALKNALIACRMHCKGDLWVVFGCGGDRDKGKRALMGEIAEQLADHITITNDNPRNETPELIATDIIAGCVHPEKITIILDRKQAVLSTLAKAKTEDLVLLAGKGHENTIIVGKNIIDYSERTVVQQFYDDQVADKKTKNETSNKLNQNKNNNEGIV